MPQLARITATFFTDLINRLGIRPPFSEGFEISNVVQPVSIVDNDIEFTATVGTLLFLTPFSAGELVAQAAGTVMADTGAQPTGNYAVTIIFGSNGAGGMDFNVQRRNAANVANVWSFYGGGPAGNFQTISFRTQLVQDERIRFVNQAAVAAGVRNQATIFLQRVT